MRFSNSSFSECVRNKHPSSPAFNSQLCTTSPFTECTFTQSDSISLSSSSSFTSCSFVSLTSDDNGGAIYFTSKTSLKVSKCFFDSCTANAKFGGAIYAKSVSIIEVYVSLFTQCKCLNSLNNDGGGAILIAAITNKPSVSNCDFICCYSKEDGVAIDIQHSTAPTQNSNTITSCRFFSNSALNGYANVGGAICIWENSPVPGLTDCLLSRSTSMSYGGALYVHFKMSTKHVIRFCMFVDNDCQANNGNEAYFDGSPNEPFFYCFSFKTGSPRIGPSNNDNWLP